MSAWWLQQKNLTPHNLLLPSTPINKGSQSLEVPTPRYKNCKGKFITKEIDSYQITIISKRNNNKYHAHTQLSIKTTCIL